MLYKLPKYLLLFSWTTTLNFSSLLKTLIMPMLAAFSHMIFLALIATLQTCNATLYNVVDFGAKADGETDSSSAFVKAWAAACRSDQESIVYVPSGTFMVNSISFDGPCKKKMQLKISGVIVAPNNYKSFLSQQAWIAFNYVSGLNVSGGVIDARGSSYWACKRGRDQANCPFGARVNSTFYSFCDIYNFQCLWYENHFFFTKNICASWS